MTNKSMLHSLSEEEFLLVGETDRTALAALDEDALVELHQRVRRARTKYVKQYRRAASARVEASGGRGKAAPKNRRDAEKAEVFEEALARTSTALAAAARRSAAELRSERIADARANRGAGPSTTPEAGDQVQAQRAQTATKTPVERKEVASSRAQGARRQARRDNR
jgi:hypothetical protein